MRQRPELPFRITNSVLCSPFDLSRSGVPQFSLPCPTPRCALAQEDYGPITCVQLQ